MEDHVRTLEAIIEKKQAELDLIVTKGWQIYQRHEKGGGNPLTDITTKAQITLQDEIRDLKTVVDGIRPQAPHQFQTEVKD
jgi:hypothetical protein